MEPSDDYRAVPTFFLELNRSAQNHNELVRRSSLRPHKVSVVSLVNNQLCAFKPALPGLFRDNRELLCFPHPLHHGPTLPHQGFALTGEASCTWLLD